MKSYIHIGLGKAASTTLQAAVFGEIPGLDFVGRRGVQPTLRNKAINAITHFNSLRYDEKQVIEELGLDFTRPFLISDEMCSTYSLIDPYIIACRLRSIVGEAKVLLITREPEDWLNSLYFFRLTRGQEDVLQDHNVWLRSNIQSSRVGSPVLQVFYAKLYEIYESVFGAGSVTLLPFEMLKYDDKRFYNNIEKFLDIEEGTINVAGLKNKKLKKRFTSEHFRLIKLLFDIETNKEQLQHLINENFSAEARSQIGAAENINAYRKLIINNILSMDVIGDTSAKVAFDRPLLRRIYAFNKAVDMEIEKKYDLSLEAYGYRSGVIPRE